jgi:hypothetical protein
MRNFEFWILAYLLNSLWQVPLLFATGWLAARALRSAGAEAKHRVWVHGMIWAARKRSWSESGVPASNES